MGFMKLTSAEARLCDTSWVLMQLSLFQSAIWNQDSREKFARVLFGGDRPSGGPSFALYVMSSGT